MLLKFPNYIRIAAFNGTRKDYFRFVNVDNSITYTQEAKFMHLLSTALHFNYSIVHPILRQVGQRLDNGTWTGLIGMVQNEEADIAMNFIGMTEGRSHVVDYSYPYYITDVTFMTHQPRPLQKRFTIFYPFSYQLWIALGVFLISMSLIFYKMHAGRNGYSRTLLMVYGSVLGESASFSTTAVSGWILSLAWLWGMMFIKLSYESTLLSFLSFPPMKGVRDIAELVKAVEADSYICLSFKGGYEVNALMQSDNEKYKIIGESVLKNSAGDLDYNLAMMGERENIALVTGRQVLSTVKSNYFISRDSFFMALLSIAIRKNFCCKHALNKVLRRIFEAGLYEKILKDREFLAFIKEGSKLDKSSGKVLHSITLDDATGALGVLITGLSIALIVFLIENIVRQNFKMTHRFRIMNLNYRCSSNVIAIHVVPSTK